MDPRVVRTRTALQHALFDLIQERRWTKITVQDLLDRTGISRSTFYAHYDNKLDVLTNGIPDLAATMMIDPTTSRLDLQPLFAHVEEMSGVVAPLLAQPVLGEIAAALEDGFAQAFASVVGTESSPTVSRFLAGAMLATIRQYAADRNRRPPPVVAAEVGS